MAYQVTAPYVTVRVPDSTGTPTTLGYYEDAFLPDSVDRESVDLLIRKGMVAEVADAVAAPEEPEPSGPVGSLDSMRPSKADPKELWVVYAATQRPEGTSEADARVQAEALTKAELIAKYGG